jgi:hypothetical protein
MADWAGAGPVAARAELQPAADIAVAVTATAAAAAIFLLFMRSPIPH